MEVYAYTLSSPLNKSPDPFSIGNIGGVFEDNSRVIKK